MEDKNARRGRDVASSSDLDAAEREIRDIQLPDTPGPYEDMKQWDRELGIDKDSA